MSEPRDNDINRGQFKVLVLWHSQTREIFYLGYNWSLLKMLSESSCKDLLQYLLSAKESSCQDFLSPQGKQLMRDSSAISRSFVVSFFTQRHPQTKTNITDRNDGLIDGTKSKSRWDFEELKDFISTNRFLLQPHWIRFPERLPRQLLVNWTWSYKNLAQKNMHILNFTLEFDIKLPRLLTWPLSYLFLLHWNVLKVLQRYLKLQTLSLTKDFAYALIYVEGIRSLFKKRPCISFF